MIQPYAVFSIKDKSNCRHSRGEGYSALPKLQSAGQAHGCPGIIRFCFPSDKDGASSGASLFVSCPALPSQPLSGPRPVFGGYWASGRSTFTSRTNIQRTMRHVGLYQLRVYGVLQYARSWFIKNTWRPSAPGANSITWQPPIHQSDKGSSINLVIKVSWPK